MGEVEEARLASGPVRRVAARRRLSRRLVDVFEIQISRRCLDRSAGSIGTVRGVVYRCRLELGI